MQIDIIVNIAWQRKWLRKESDLRQIVLIGNRMATSFQPCVKILLESLHLAWKDVFFDNVLTLRPKEHQKRETQEDRLRLGEASRREEDWTDLITGARQKEPTQVIVGDNPEDLITVVPKMTGGVFSPEFIWTVGVRGGMNEYLSVMRWEFGWSAEQYEHFLKEEYATRQETPTDWDNIPEYLYRAIIQEQRAAFPYKETTERGKTWAAKGPLRETKHAVIDPELHRGGSFIMPARVKGKKGTRIMQKLIPLEQKGAGAPIMRMVYRWYRDTLLPDLRLKAGWTGVAGRMGKPPGFGKHYQKPVKKVKKKWKRKL